jgi:hypothetical protein
MVNDLNDLISDIGEQVVLDFLKKTSFNDLLFKKNPNIQLKFDEINFSIEYLMNHNELSWESEETLYAYNSFISKYFLKLSYILTEDFAWTVRKLISSYFENNIQLDFNVIDWYYSFNVNDSTFYDSIQAPIALNDEKYRALQDEEVSNDSDNRYYKKQHYLVFWRGFMSYIRNYEEILIRKKYKEEKKIVPEVRDSFIPDFKPRWSPIVTPEILFKCIEIRDNDCNGSTEIMKKTSKHFSEFENQNVHFTTIRDWIKSNKGCMKKFQDQKESTIVSTMKENDIKDWFETLQLYDIKFEIMVNKLKK